MKYLIGISLSFLISISLIGQQWIESTNVELKMKKDDIDRIVLNSGTPFLFPLPATIGINDIFGNQRISLIGNDFYNPYNPVVHLRGKVEVDSTYTLFQLSNELHGGTWGLGLGSYDKAGTALNSFNITADGESQFKIDEDGNVFIESLAEFSTLRPLLIDSKGKIIAPASTQSDYSIQFSEFLASDGDGAETEIVRLGKGFGFVQHKGDITDTGEMIAPLHLRNGVNIIGMIVYYVNEAGDESDGNKYEISVHQTPKLANTQSQVITSWNTLPVAGAITSNPFGEILTTASHQILFDTPVQIINFFDMYSLVVKCENCSEQYLRSVDIYYTY